MISFLMYIQQKTNYNNKSVLSQKYCQVTRQSTIFTYKIIISFIIIFNSEREKLKIEENFNTVIRKNIVIKKII